MQREQIIDIALIISILVQLTKFSDFIFSEKQKKIFQNKAEDFTLRLSELNPQRYMQLVFQERFSRNFALAIAYAILFAFSGALIYALSENGKVVRFKSVSEVIGGTFIICLTGAIGFKIYGFRLLNWLLRRKFWFFVLRWYLLSLVMNILIILISGIVIGEDFGIHKTVQYSVLWLIILSGFGVISYVLLLYGMVVILYQIILFIIIILVKFSKWFAWRVAEYNKGAIAAISLVLTIALGIIDIIIKSK